MTLTPANRLLLQQAQARRNVAKARYDVASPSTREARHEEYLAALEAHQDLVDRIASGVQ